jgi:peroxiredoxin
MREKNSLEFDILRDPGNETAEKFGLRYELPEYLREIYRQFPLDLARVNGEDSWTLPMPARYVIGQAGIVRAADFDPDYRYRPEPAKTLEDLRKLMEL